MKTRLLLIAVIFCMATRSMATIHMIMVSNFSFTPQSFTAHPGDTVMWMWSNGIHTTTSTTIPSDAGSWNSPIDSTHPSFMYIPTVVGAYSYQCNFHASLGMVGSFTVVNATSVAAVNDAHAFSVFPNPATGAMHVQFSNANSQVLLKLTDITGREVARQQYQNTAQADLNVTGVPNGTYFVSVSQDGKVYQQEVVVTH